MSKNTVQDRGGEYHGKHVMVLGKSPWLLRRVGLLKHFRLFVVLACT